MLLEDSLRRKCLLGAMIIALLTMLPAWTDAAADGPPPGLKIEAGAAFDGYFKYGEWLPLWVHLENTGPDLQTELRVRVTGSGGATTFAAPVLLPTGSRKRVPIYVLPNNFSHELELELVSGSKVLAGQKIPVEPRANHSYFVGLIAPERGALALIQNVSLPGQERPKELVHFSLNDLPERTEGLRSFDCLILNDVDTSPLTPEQGAALEAWVRQGGRLIIGGGAGAVRTAAGLPESLLPLAPRDLIEVDELPELADFAGAEAVRVPGPFIVAGGELLEGRTLIIQGNLPLARERAVGSGHVDFMALDLSASPFDAWAGTIAFWEQLLSPGAAYPDWLPPDMSSRQMKSGQMAYALSMLPSLDLPSIRGLGLLLALYVILVGPVNYFLLRRRNRLHRAWITIPLITVAFSAGAFGLGYALRGSDLILSKIAVVQVGPDGAAEVSSYMGLFSPARQSYEIDVPGASLLAPLNPGYNPWGPSAVNTGGETVFVQGEPGRVRGLAVNQWSMQTFMTEGLWPDLGRIAGDMQVKGDALSGTVRNETGRRLTDVVIVLGNRFVRLGDLPPGKELPVTMELPELVSELNGPLSWRLFRDNNPGIPSREAELKRTVLENVLDQGRYGPVSSIAPWSGSDAPQGLLLIAWLDEAPPDVQVAGRRPIQHTTALLYTSLSLHLPAEGDVSLPPGLVPGRLVQMPFEGGPCGADMSAVYIGRGEAVFEFQLPQEVQDVQVKELKLVIGTDGGWGLPPDTAIYNWDKETWVEIDGPILGVNVFSDAAGLVSEDGLARVRLSSEGGRGGCLYVELGLEGVR